MDAGINFSGHWLEVIAGIYLLGMVLYGHYKGFLRLAVSALALIITLAGVRIALPYAVEWLKNETPVYEMIQSGVEQAIGIDSLFDEEKSEEAGPGFMGPGENAEAEAAVIRELKLPELLKEALIENNTAEVYQKLGVELFRDYIEEYLVGLIVRTATFFLLFLVVYILLRILAAWLDLVARLPILSGINKIAGAILGGAEALVVIWLLFLLFTALSGTSFGMAVMEQIGGSGWLTYLYRHNLLANFFMGLLSIMI